MIYATSKSSTNTSTKCAKMIKEEQNRKDALNGNGERAAGAATPNSDQVKEELPRSAYAHGGRLKFFKDGKFILELERAREGERVSWVSVPRKTFWPPQGTASSTPSYRQESSTSLSVSDDNSSIQSSPWQRDHSWKQTSPRKNVSRELCFYFRRPRDFNLGRSGKRRRPHDSALENLGKVVKRTRDLRKRPGLMVVVQVLVDRVGTGSPPRAETVVSPRKRFLREMEKDGRQQADDACLKRSRSRPMVAAPTASSVIKVGSPVRLNGASSATAVPSATVDDPPARAASRNSSYSITSLLASDRSSSSMSSASVTVKKSPANSPSHFSQGPPSIHHHQYCPTTPSPEDRLYKESVDRLRSIELSHPEKRLYSQYPSSYMSPFMYTFPIPPQYYPNFPRSFGAIPSIYPMPLQLRPDQAPPSSSWAAEPNREIPEHRDDNITDMPLNLSKHAG